MTERNKSTPEAQEAKIDRILDAVIDLPASKRMAKAMALSGEDRDLATRLRQILEVDQSADFLPLDKGGSGSGPSCLDEESARALGCKIGAWEVVGRIGRGGMGEVLEVQRADGQYQMRAALKRLHEQGLEHADRLERERQILAALRHPNIAQLIDGGIDDEGRPWMVMEYVEGQPLSDWAKSATVEQKLDVFAQLLSAVRHAHGQLVIHRDIKPSNVLVDKEGRASLLDFGIAKLLNALQTGDRTQSIATPNYAAPEQLLGQPVAVHADIYGLGATLYFLLCGEPPIELEGQSLPVVVDRICHQFPAPPSSRAPGAGIHTDLDAICLKCLQKDPGDRYDTVAELMQDLERLRTGFPVLARSPGQLDYARHFVRRHRLAVSAALVVLAALVFGMALTSWQAGIARQERDVARLEARRISGLRSAVTTLFRKAVNTDTSLTTRELFERAATVADEEFQNDPSAASALLQMLGHLHLQGEDYPAARSLLQRVLDMPRSQVMPEVLSDAHLDMAHIEFRDRNFDAVREQLDRVQTIWRHSDKDFRNEKLQLATLQSQLARAEGRNEDAIRILKDAISLAREYWGPKHPETAILLVNLGATQYYSGDIPAAIASSAAAYEIYRAIGEDQSPDALNLLANWGLYALRAGRPVEAEKRLGEALDLRTALYGASAAQAVLMKNLGLAHLVNGKQIDGLDLLEQSRWMAERYAGPNSHLFVSSTCTLARVHLENNSRSAARKILEALPDELYQRDTHWAEFCSGLRKLARAGDLELSSGVDLQDELGALQARGPRRLNYFADLQATQGKLLSTAHAYPEAVEALRAAADAKAQARGAEHYETLSLRLETAFALQRADQDDEARLLKRTSLQKLTQTLGPSHALVRHYRDMK